MKKQNVLISIFLMVALNLAFIGCDTGTNSTSGGPGGTGTGTGTGGTGTGGTGTGGTGGTGTDIWTTITSLEQFIGTWENTNDYPEFVVTASSINVEGESISLVEFKAGLAQSFEVSSVSLSINSTATKIKLDAGEESYYFTKKGSSQGTGGAGTGGTGGSVDLSNISIDDIPSLEDLGLDTIDIPENLEEFEAPDGWTLVNSWDQVRGTWVTAFEEESEGLELVGIKSYKITTDTIVLEVFYDWSDIENIADQWDSLKEDWEEEGWILDDKNYTMTLSMELSLDVVSFEEFMYDIALLSADKKTLVLQDVRENGGTNERSIWEWVFLKVE